jgi:hypothetical protein
MATSDDKPVLITPGRIDPRTMWICHHCEANFRSKPSQYRGSSGDDDGYYVPIECPSCGKGQTITVERPSPYCKKIVYTILLSHP